MSWSFERRLQRAERQVLPQPEPDMTGLTTQECLLLLAERHGLRELIRQSRACDTLPPEAHDARDAEDEAILAGRAADAAADVLARNPTSGRARQAARETRDAADKATRVAEQARRLAEERRPTDDDDE